MLGTCTRARTADAAGAQRVVDHENAFGAGALEIARESGLLDTVVAGHVEVLGPERRHDLHLLAVDVAYHTLGRRVRWLRPMRVGEIVEERGRRLLHVREVKAIEQCLGLRPEHEHMLCGQLPANVLAQAVRTLPQLLVSLVGFLEVVQRLLWTFHLRRVVQV